MIGALAGLRRSELIARPLLGRTKGKLREGFAYVRNQPDVRRPLVVMAVVGTMALNFQTTFPSMVRFEFDLGAGSIGTAMSVSAIGSILGGIYIAGVQPDSRRTLGIVLVGFAATLITLGLAPGYWAFVALSIPLGFASASFQSVDTVVLQRATEPAMQGRVMALQQMAWFGSTPIGALLMGWVIQVSSPRVPFAVGGLSALASAAAVVLMRRADKPIEGITHAAAVVAVIAMTRSVTPDRSPAATQCSANWRASNFASQMEFVRESVDVGRDRSVQGHSDDDRRRRESPRRGSRSWRRTGATIECR